MKILRPHQTVAKVGLCDRRIRQLEAEGKFPKRFPINPYGGRAVGHLEADIDEWIAKRAAGQQAAHP